MKQLFLLTSMLVFAVSLSTAQSEDQNAKVLSSEEAKEQKMVFKKVEKKEKKAAKAEKAQNKAEKDKKKEQQLVNDIASNKRAI